MSVGGLTRHLVSQPECAVEFLTLPIPAGAQRQDLLTYVESWDWLDAPVEHEANTSIRDDFNDMSKSGPTASIEILTEAAAKVTATIANASPMTFVPWQGIAIGTDDFLACRLMLHEPHGFASASCGSRRRLDYDM